MPSRGFITIATGNPHYYQIAKNLVKSYRYFSKNPLPFAIICEERNQYTDIFDDVIITNEATHSFADKFLLLKLCPYDETIFLDADILAFGDLNQWWAEFEEATDFSAPGANIYPPYSKDDGSWYNLEDIGKWGENVDYKCRMHAGVIFIRKTEKIDAMYRDCMDMYTNYDKVRFWKAPDNVDECIFAATMPIHQMKAIHEKADLLGFYPCLYDIKADILHDKLIFKTAWGTSTDKGALLHWGTVQTYKPLYRFNVKCLDYLCSGNSNWGGYLLYEKRIYYYILVISDFLKLNAIRVRNKIMRLTHR